MKLYLQDIVSNFDKNNISVDWQNIDFAKFSIKKILFDYQQEAFENTLFLNKFSV